MYATAQMRNAGATNRPARGCGRAFRKRFFETGTAIWRAKLNLSRRTTSIKPITTNESTTGEISNGTNGVLVRWSTREVDQKPNSLINRPPKYPRVKV